MLFIVAALFVAWELGPQGRDYDLSVAWGLQGLMERGKRIMTFQGIGIRTPERGLGLLCGRLMLLNNAGKKGGDYDLSGVVYNREFCDRDTRT